ncbi:MAG TPA: YggS family pyridoxal phosphate-dependent enzyme [Candidatus Cybelea sp.]
MSEGAAERYLRLRDEIDRELRESGRDLGAVTLVGVGKGQPTEALTAAIAAGLKDLGENYLQEARQTFSALPPVRKHFIGHIQTNKASGIAAAFDLVQSVDRPEAGVALAKAAQRLEKRLPVLLQVNVSPTERFGCAPADAPRLAETLRRLPSLRLEGVMAIGPLDADRAAIERAFALAAKTLASVGGSTLSIGMSGDWREALRAGSTMLRIGEALFGPRPGKGRQA